MSHQTPGSARIRAC
ncbi:hypothetical protein ACV5Z5_002097 [Salmonella enterica subsp. enterica]